MTRASCAAASISAACPPPPPPSIPFRTDQELSMQTASIVPESEPPSLPASETDRMMALAHLPGAAHVAVIGRHTLPFVLALMQRGCTCVRSLRPDAAAPDCEPVDLAWIVDVANEHELDDALRAARRRAGETGRVVLESAVCRTCSTPAEPCGGGRPRSDLDRPSEPARDAGARPHPLPWQHRCTPSTQARCPSRRSASPKRFAQPAASSPCCWGSRWSSARSSACALPSMNTGTGNAPLVRHLFGALVPGPDQTSR